MKFSLTILSMVLFSGIAHSAVDYSACQNQMNRFKVNTSKCDVKWGMFYYCSNQADKGEFYPFELMGDGSIKPFPSLNYRREGDKEYITSQAKDQTPSTTIITRNDKGEISDISTTYDMPDMSNAMMKGYPGTQSRSQKAKPDFERKYTQNIKLEIKNGKCFPSRIDTVNSFGDESRQDVHMDMKLCRDLGQFFKKNPEAKSCFDGKLMNEANEIFANYFKNNSDIYGESSSYEQFSMSPKAKGTKIKSSSVNAMGGIGFGMAGGGLGFGMPGASTEQILTPIIPSVDMKINKSKAFGGSPITSANEIYAGCTGGTYGYPEIDYSAIMNDDAIWKAETPAEAKEAKTIAK